MVTEVLGQSISQLGKLGQFGLPPSDDLFRNLGSTAITGLLSNGSFIDNIANNAGGITDLFKKGINFFTGGRGSGSGSGGGAGSSVTSSILNTPSVFNPTGNSSGGGSSVFGSGINPVTGNFLGL